MLNDVDKSYAAWKAAPAPDTLASVVKSLQPTIQYSLSAVNAPDDPVVRSQALLYAADAVERYDPVHAGGATLPTFVSSHLRQLSRQSRVARMPVKIPEKIQLDAYHLHKKTQEFLEKHNREPDALELADFSGMPVHRIEKVRRYQMVTPTEGAGVSGVAFEPAYDQEAMDYIHTESDHIDRRILELKTGYGGSPQMSPIDIAAKLKLTPSQLSRRSMRLAHRIHTVQTQLAQV